MPWGASSALVNRPSANRSARERRAWCASGPVVADRHTHPYFAARPLSKIGCAARRAGFCGSSAATPKWSAGDLSATEAARRNGDTRLADQSVRQALQLSAVDADDERVLAELLERQDWHIDRQRD